jgi:hypothetical protein
MTYHVGANLGYLSEVVFFMLLAIRLLPTSLLFILHSMEESPKALLTLEKWVELLCNLFGILYR